MKTCNSCGETKPTSEYYKTSRGRLGVEGRCKSCRASAGKKWYSSNKERRKETADLWASNNKARRSAASRRWREENPDRMKQLVSDHYHSNKADYRARDRRRRALLAEVESEPYTLEQVWSKTNGECGIKKLCDGKTWAINEYGRGGWVIDHIKPLALGGNDTLINVQVGCDSCNDSKGWRE